MTRLVVAPTTNTAPYRRTDDTRELSAVPASDHHRGPMVIRGTLAMRHFCHAPACADDRGAAVAVCTSRRFAGQ